MINNKDILLQVLKQIQTKGPAATTSGICGNAQELLAGKLRHESHIGAAMRVLHRLMRMWPKSVEPLFPIEGAEIYVNVKNKWEGEYGRLREELLQYLIEEVEKEI